MLNSLAALATIRNKGLRTARLEAWNHYRLQSHADARAGFERVLAQFPGDGDALSGLDYTSLAAGPLDEAAAHFDQVLAKEADDVAAIEGLAHVRYRQGRSEDARALFERAAELNPDNGETRQMLDKLRTSSPSAPAPPATGNASASADPRHATPTSFAQA